MASTLEFVPPRRRSKHVILAPAKRLLGNKLQEIAQRSPLDLRAFDTLADFVLDRLDELDHGEPSRGGVAD